MNFLVKSAIYLNKKSERKTTGEIIAIVVIGIIIMLYLPLIIVFLRIHYASHVTLPKEFGLSTLILICTIWVVRYTRLYKENDQYRKLRKIVAILFTLTSAFLLAQFRGSRKIFSLAQYKEIKIIALIVMYHALQLCVIVGMFITLLLKTRMIHSAADWYIYFLNPKHHFTFKHNFLFWNFSCILWVGLYVMMILKCH
jgi:hypothetical protein